MSPTTSMSWQEARRTRYKTSLISQQPGTLSAVNLFADFGRLAIVDALNSLWMMKISIRDILEHPIGSNHRIPGQMTRGIDIDHPCHKIENSRNGLSYIVAGRYRRLTAIGPALLLPHQIPSDLDRVIRIGKLRRIVVMGYVILPKGHRAVIGSAHSRILQAHGNNAIGSITSDRHDLIPTGKFIDQEGRDGIGMPGCAADGCGKKRQGVYRNIVIRDDRCFSTGEKDAAGKAQHQRREQDFCSFHILRFFNHTNR